MRLSVTATVAAATLGAAALAEAQTSPPPAQPKYSNSAPAAASQQSMQSERSGAPENNYDSSAQQTSPNASDSSANPSAAGASRNRRIAGLLPTGMSAQEACGGFRSISECAAVLHAAQNTGIAFKDLKSKVAGGEKLGAALHELKPDADARAEVSRAEEQARTDLRSPQG